MCAMGKIKMGIESWQIEVAREAQNDSIKLGRASYGILIS